MLLDSLKGQRGWLGWRSIRLKREEGGPGWCWRRGELFRGSEKGSRGAAKLRTDGARHVNAVDTTTTSHPPPPSPPGSGLASRSLAGWWHWATAKSSHARLGSNSRIRFQAIRTAPGARRGQPGGGSGAPRPPIGWVARHGGASGSMERVSCHHARLHREPHCLIEERVRPGGSLTGGWVLVVVVPVSRAVLVRVSRPTVFTSR